MKKVLILSLLLLGTLPVSLGAATDADGRTAKGPLGRIGIVEGRGFLNLLGSPAELCSTARREADSHPRLWPLTYWPRLVGNLVLRITSGIADIAFYPWVVPFTDDISPWTESYGLPEYPWQKE